MEDGSLAQPPASPVLGQGWIVGAGATGEWAGREDSLAVWTEGGWRFVTPAAGMMAWNKAQGFWIHWSGTDWSAGLLPAAGIVVGGHQVLGARQPSIASPSGGTTINVEARAAIDAVIAAFRSHGLTD